MSMTRLYQNFAPTEANFVQDGIDEAELEDQKLKSFESGYQAGWDDAVHAQNASQSRLLSDLEKNLQHIDLTASEIRKKLLGELNELFQEIADVLLPDMARNLVGPHILEELNRIAAVELEHVIEITVGPTNVDIVSDLIKPHIARPFTIVANQHMGEGQVSVRVNTTETAIDLDQLSKDIASAMKTLLADNFEAA